MRIWLKTSILWWRHGSIVALAKESGISRATLYRWQNTRTNKHPLPPWQRLVKLSQALDIDPVMLLDFDGKAPMDVLRDVVLSRLGPSRQPQQAELQQEIARYVFGEEDQWPQRFTHDDREWHRARFDGEGKPGNRWARLRVRVPPRAGPQLWHWAYRAHRVKPREFYWIPYGFVSRFDGTLTIELYNGVRRHVACPGDEFIVETWFGGGEGSDFCVASLHPFALQLMPHDEPRDVAYPTVRFGDPDEA